MKLFILAQVADWEGQKPHYANWTERTDVQSCKPGLGMTNFAKSTYKVRVLIKAGETLTHSAACNQGPEKWWSMCFIDKSGINNLHLVLVRPQRTLLCRKNMCI